MNRTLDYVPRLHPANRAYRITAADPELLNRSRYWVPGVVLDQGTEGACVGFGTTGEYLASPVRGKAPGPTTAKYPATVWGEMLALTVYRRAKEIDEWEGVDYDGTSVRAGMLVARERGWIDGFRWAFNMLELRAALESGPVVIGVEWNEHMYDAPNGVVTTGGFPVGGHCLLVTGYTPHHPVIRGPAYRWRNSWGTSYGRNGSAYISDGALDLILFQAGGEAAVVEGRHL